MGLITNKVRGEWAEKGIEAYMLHKDEQIGERQTSLESEMECLLCDLMHWADGNEVSFDVAMDAAKKFYERELADEANA